MNTDILNLKNVCRKNLRFHAIFWLCFLFISIPGIGDLYSQEYVIPHVIPPSPEAQEFMKYMGYPVDQSTGVPQIEIPLYTIRTPNLELPIYLSYHASGIKPEDIASPVGLGWTLFSGGMVSRSVRGKPDENGLLINGVHTSEEIDDFDPWDYSNKPLINALIGYCSGLSDNESDIYSYLVNKGISGNFIFDTDKNMVKTSLNNDSVFWNYTTGNWFRIIDEKGIQYYFEQKEIITINNGYYSAPFSWHLTKIKYPDGNDSICFEYFKNPYPYNKATANHTAYFNPIDGVDVCFHGPLGHISGGTQYDLGYFKIRECYSASEHVMINKISYTNGHIDFIYNNNRMDQRKHQLDSIKIYSSSPNDSVLLKQYYLNHSYFGDTSSSYTCRLRLDKVIEYDAKGAFINKYEFGYNSTLLPDYYQSTSTNFPYDFWGYYNAQPNNHMIPYLPPGTMSAANRDPDETYTQACILNQVNYPTGGYTKFYYELNKLDDLSCVGGLRIKKMEVFPDNGTEPIIKTYTYSGGNTLRSLDLENEYIIQYPINVSCQEFGQPWCNHYVYVDWGIYYAEPIHPIANHNGSPVLYQFIDEFTYGNDTQNSKIRSIYHIESDVDYNIDCDLLNDKYIVDRSWARGQLVGQDFYEYNTDTRIYTITKRILKNYEEIQDTSTISGLYVFRIIGKEGDCASEGYSYFPLFPHDYDFFNILTDIGVKKLISQEEYNYFKDDTLIITTTYDYGTNKYLYPESVTTYQSTGDLQEVLYKYVSDYNNVSNYITLKSKNIVSNPIDVRKYVNDILVAGTQYKYSNYGKPIDIYSAETGGEDVTFYASNPYTFTHKVKYDYDSNNNLVQIKKADDYPTSFLWGYNNALPVAKVENATSQEIFHENFEEFNRQGWWSPQSGTLDDANFIVGELGTRVFKISNGSYILKELTSPSYTFEAGKRYNINVKGRCSTSVGQNPYLKVRNNGGNEIIQYIPKTGKWEQLSIDFTYYGGTIEIYLDAQSSPQNVYFEEVRLYPAVSQMTTYTHKPLIGISSQTDPNGILTVYEYDGTGRLNRIRDNDKNILREHAYNYFNSTLPSLSVNPSNVNFPSAGGNTNISVSCNTNWTAYNNQGWFTVNPSSGDKNTTSFTLTCEVNTGAYREGTATVTAGDTVRNINITQDAYDFSLNMIEPEYNTGPYENPLLIGSADLYYVFGYDDDHDEERIELILPIDPVNIDVEYEFDNEYGEWIYIYNVYVYPNLYEFYIYDGISSTSYALIEITSNGITRKISVKVTE